MIQTRLKKEELQLLMASVSDAIWSADIAGPGQFRYRYWSPVIESIAGVPPERLACSRQAWLEVVHPAARDRVQQILARITMGGSDKEEAEYRIVRADGATRWVRDSIRATRFGGGRAVLNGMISDITPRKEAESALRESEERFRSLTQLSSDWYWKQDAQFRFVDFSGDVAEMPAWHPTSSIGHRRDELPGVTLLTGSWAEHQAVLEARLPFRDFEYSRPGDDGQTRYIRVSGGPVFDDRGEFLGYEGIGRDVTERRRAEEEVRRLEDQLRHAQRLEAVGTLAGGIAHDFNNILGAILGYGEMALRDAAAGTRLKRDLDSIMIAGERGRVLVDRILMFSRSSVGEKISVPVQDVVQEAIDLVVDRIPRDIRVETRFEAGRAAMLGDPTQVHQVVSNLAMNALQAMPDGGFLRISLTLQREERTRIATVGSLAPGEYIVLTVADTGTGIRKDILERIFDPFFTTKEVGVGTGLGLSLVHGIVTNVRGAVDVQSKSGVGSTFTVYLPRSGSAPVEDTADPASSHLVHGSGEVVLIVDDEEALVQLASDNLLSLGYVPVPYTSSLRALDAFRADPGRFDAALVDERMPGMSGMSLIRELRAVRSHFPVLLVTGLVNDDVIAAARQAGASDVLKKPVLLRELATRLAATIAGGVPASEPAQET
jgi:PAS domain S-box-containing protein